MKINEILVEQNTGALQPDVAAAIPQTTVLTQVKNTDPYRQYRMGLAIAGARARAAGEIPEPDKNSAWGENMVVVAYTPEDQETLEMGLALMPGENVQKSITTPKSEESPTVGKQSPVQPRGPITKRTK